MEIVRRVHAMKQVSRNTRARGLRIGFVPTMGFLHEGHLSLIRYVAERTDVVVVSIFVNPTQFGEGEDYDSYPRDLTRDADLCIAEGVEYLFAPEAREIYPAGPRTIVDVEELSARWEGRSRPGHFRGMSTVVMKLLHVVQPDVAAFGQKDAQQAVIVRRMVEDMLMDCEVLIAPIVRDDDGLALSSRNTYLDETQRKAAVALSRGLEAAEAKAREGERSADELRLAFEQVVGEEPLLKIDYAAVVDPATMQPIEQLDDRALMIAAVFCGEIRLLDNRFVEIPDAEAED